MKKRLLSLFLVIAVVICTISIPMSVAAAPTCYQQGDPTWGGTYFGKWNLAESGCGILSTVNAVNYLTGNFINPTELAQWGYNNNYYNGTYGQGTVRATFYENVTAAFGSKYGFKVSNQTWSNIYNTTLKNHLIGGGAVIVHCPNHFMAITAYDSATSKFLVYDSAAAPKRNTSSLGSWLTADQINGNSLTKVDWFCLVTRTGSAPVTTPTTLYTTNAVVASGEGTVHFGNNITSAGVTAGTVVNYQVTPAAGYKASSVVVGGTAQAIKNNGEDAVYQFTMPQGNCDVVVTFEKIQTEAVSGYYNTFDMTVPSTTVHNEKVTASYTYIKGSMELIDIYGWSVNVAGTKSFYYTVDGGTTQTAFNKVQRLDVLLSGSYSLFANYCDSVNIGFETTFNPSDLSVGAHTVDIFAIDNSGLSYEVGTVTINVEGNDTLYETNAIVKSGNGTVHFGNNITTAGVIEGTIVNFRTTPADGYVVSEILVGGNSIAIQNNGGDCVYQFTMPAANCDVEVTFTSVITDYRQHYLDIGFPESYIPILMALHEQHPTWQFTPLKITEINNSGYTWDYVIEQMLAVPARNLMVKATWAPEPFTALGDGNYAPYRDESKGTFDSGTWYAITPEATRYFIDPRNFLNEVEAFMFLDWNYTGNTFTAEHIEKVLEGSVFANTVIPDLDGTTTYAQYIVDTATALQVNPLFVASRLKQENGNGSPMVDGTTGDVLGNAEYNGLYNFFNIEAGGSGYEQIYTNGMNEAIKGTPSKTEEWGGSPSWDKRWKAVYGGILKLKTDYVGGYKNTLYLQKFNTDPRGRNTFSGYMQNVIAPITEGRSMRKSIVEYGLLESSFEFIIPVYDGMPAYPCADPGKGITRCSPTTPPVTGYGTEYATAFDGGIGYPPQDNAPIEITHNVTDAESAVIEIRGWSVCKSGVESHYYTIDGGERIALDAQKRDDVINAYPDYSTYCEADKVGFSGTLDVRSLTDGTHNIAVYGVADSGNTYNVANITVNYSYINPVYISTAEDLFNITDNDGIYVLENDIDLGGISLEKYIGSAESPFTGVFDGNGYVISNFKIDPVPRSSNGLFGEISGDALIANLGVENVSVVQTTDDWEIVAGGIVGKMTGTAVVTDCYVKNINMEGIADAVGERFAAGGGIVGWMAGDGAVLKNSYCLGYTAVDVNYEAGLVGRMTTAGDKLVNCYTDTLATIYNAPSEPVNVVNTYYAAVNGIPWPWNEGWVGNGGEGIYLGFVGIQKTADELKAIAQDLGTSFVASDNYPVLYWETTRLEKVDHIIYTADDLRNITVDQYGDSFRLANDIDMGGECWSTYIGTEENQFTGTFDGNGHIISNFTINPAPYKSNGLFGEISGSAVIKNLGVENVSAVQIVDDWEIVTGGIVGKMTGTAVVTDCYAKDIYMEGIADAVGERFAAGGGIAGWMAGDGAEIKNSYCLGLTAVNVNYDAGIAGRVTTTTDKITSCYSDTLITVFNAASEPTNIVNTYYGAVAGIPWPGNQGWVGAGGEGIYLGYAGYNVDYSKILEYTELLGESFVTNDGVSYPMLSWENANAVKPDLVILNVEQYAAKSVAVVKNNSGETINADVAVAVYDGDKLVASQIVPMSLGVGTTRVNFNGLAANGKAVKAFIWNSELEPLCVNK